MKLERKKRTNAVNIIQLIKVKITLVYNIYYRYIGISQNGK